MLAIGDAVVASLDVLVEGVHFRRDWSEARDVGRKAVAVNIADIEAIGAPGNWSPGRLLRTGRPARGLGTRFRRRARPRKPGGRGEPARG